VIHHRKPRRLGGSDLLDNLQLLCEPCHLEADNEIGSRGRPLGIVFPVTVFSLLTDKQAEWFALMAREQGTSKAELFRRLVEEEAKRRGLK
jgi:hypothetical protein